MVGSFGDARHNRNSLKDDLQQAFRVVSLKYAETGQNQYHKMTEVSFAKSFLAALDNRPQKLSADHVEDPKSYPRQTAVCASLQALLLNV